MATADYRLCDVCDGKVFYDANLNYEQGRDSEWAKRQAPFRWAGEEQGKPENDDWLLRLDFLGDWAVICSDCAKTHKTAVVPIERSPDEPKREPNPDEVICPACTHQFRAIPENVQAQLSAKREPLTVSRILDIEADAIRQWRDNGRIIEFTVVFARMIERTHGIGGDDAE